MLLTRTGWLRWFNNLALLFTTEDGSYGRREIHEIYYEPKAICMSQSADGSLHRLITDVENDSRLEKATTRARFLLNFGQESYPDKPLRLPRLSKRNRAKATIKNCRLIVQRFFIYKHDTVPDPCFESHRSLSSKNRPFADVEHRPRLQGNERPLVIVTSDDSQTANSKPYSDFLERAKDLEAN